MSVCSIFHLIYYPIIGIFSVYMIYCCFASTRRGKNNMATAMSKSDEIAAQAHADAARVVALLTEIRDQLDRRARADEPR